MLTPDNREADLHPVNRAQTTRNPRTGSLETIEGESEIELHEFQKPKPAKKGEPEPDPNICRACEFPLDSRPHNEYERLKQESEHPPAPPAKEEKPE